MKTCNKCGIVKKISGFYKKSDRSSGHSAHCKSCADATVLAWRAKNKTRTRLVKAKYESENFNRRKVKKAEWKKANPTLVRLSNNKWAAANLELRRINNHNRRARKRENGGKLSPGLAEKLFKLQRGKCACCKQPLGTDYHMDHISPVALEGANEDWNIQLLRAKCNQQKGVKTPIDFMQAKGFLL